MKKMLMFTSALLLSMPISLAKNYQNPTYNFKIGSHTIRSNSYNKNIRLVVPSSDRKKTTINVNKGRKNGSLQIRSKIGNFNIKM